MMKIKQQAETFMKQIQTRRRDPAKPKTVRAYQSYLDRWIVPQIGEMSIADVENGTAKALVATLSQSLAPTTIGAVLNVVKLIVASATDANGNQLYPRTWNADFIDSPVVKRGDLDAPTIAPESISQAISRARGADKALYAILGGTGLRIGEALALQTSDTGSNSFWNRETGVIYVKTTLVHGEVQSSPKTEAGIRQVDLAPALNDYLRTILHPTGQFLFPSQAGGPARLQTAYKHLQEAGIDTGFHAFRRFRVTHLENQNVPRGLVQFWTGHAAADITDRYVRIGSDIEARRQWCEKAGLGFEIPKEGPCIL